MGYYGYFGQDDSSPDGSMPDGSTDPYGSSADGSTPPGSPQTSLPGSTPGSPYTPPGSGTPSGLPGSTPPSGLPGSTPGSIVPSGNTGLTPYSSGSSTPGGVISGGSSMALPQGQPWATAPIVMALANSPTNGLLFTSPSGQEANWLQLVVRQMASMGYFAPTNSAAAQGAISALAQAYGYYMSFIPPDPTTGTAGMANSPFAQAAYTMQIALLLNDAYNAVIYMQSSPVYQTSYTNALNTYNAWKGITPQLIASAAAAANALTPPGTPPAGAASGKTMLYVGLAGALGIAAYLALA